MGPNHVAIDGWLIAGSHNVIQQSGCTKKYTSAQSKLLHKRLSICKWSASQYYMEVTSADQWSKMARVERIDCPVELWYGKCLYWELIVIMNAMTRIGRERIAKVSKLNWVVGYMGRPCRMRMKHWVHQKSLLFFIVSREGRWIYLDSWTSVVWHVPRQIWQVRWRRCLWSERIATKQM